MLNPGEFFGDISLFNDQPVTATIVSGTCLCHILHQSNYELLKFRHPELEGLLRAASHRRNYQQLSPFLKPPKLLLGLPADMVRALVGRLTIKSVEAGEVVLSDGSP